ncbi:MAG: pentapeptide repeat-containing protein [Kiloniellales bacterium]|nr:pentapeptide repeat-containing protein [Kiloniellales bacterium]
MVRANKLRLKGANLTSANLQEMKLYDSDLSDATFEGTVITFAIFQDAYMDGCRGCPFDW